MYRPALLSTASLLFVLSLAACASASPALPVRYELVPRPAIRQAGSAQRNVTKSEQSKIRNAKKMKKTPLHGVGGGFIVLAIATVFLVVLHFVLRGMSKRTAELLDFAESEHSFSEVWTTTQNIEEPRSSQSGPPGGYQMRESFSFKKPDGSWVHSNSESLSKL